MEHEIYIPQPQADIILQEAANREVSVEELLCEIIHHYMESLQIKSQAPNRT